MHIIPSSRHHLPHLSQDGDPGRVARVRHASEGSWPARQQWDYRLVPAQLATVAEPKRTGQRPKEEA